MRKLKNCTLLLLFCIGLSACVSTAGLDKGPGALLSKGLLAGELGRGLDAKAMRVAINAEIAALSNSATGVESTWKSGTDTSGKIIPGQPYEVSGRICRRYSHAITSKGQVRSGETTACQNEDGIWEPLS